MNSSLNGLLNSTTLDVILGLVFVYLLLAIMCTTINEWLAGMLKTRSTNLASAIKQLLDAQPGTGTAAVSFLQQFYDHPLISGMRTPGKTGDRAHPAYLSARAFATAIMDIATPTKPGAITFKDLQDGLTAMPNGDVKTALLALIQNARGDLGQAQKNIESWYDDTMDRASGWYKRKLQIVTVIIAAVLTIAANADTIAIVRTLWSNPTQRAVLVQQAGVQQAGVQQAGNHSGSEAGTPPKISKEEIEATLGDVLGWNKNSANLDWRGWATRSLGWFLTIVAVSLGAPFWFDILNKIINIRNAGKKPETSETQSEKLAAASAGDLAPGAAKTT
jgi:hypothetical protein